MARKTKKGYAKYGADIEPFVYHGYNDTRGNWHDPGLDKRWAAEAGMGIVPCMECGGYVRAENGISVQGAANNPGLLQRLCGIGLEGSDKRDVVNDNRGRGPTNADARRDLRSYQQDWNNMVNPEYYAGHEYDDMYKTTRPDRRRYNEMRDSTIAVNPALFGQNFIGGAYDNMEIGPEQKYAIAHKIHRLATTNPKEPYAKRYIQQFGVQDPKSLTVGQVAENLNTFGWPNVANWWLSGGQSNMQLYAPKQPVKKEAGGNIYSTYNNQDMKYEAKSGIHIKPSKRGTFTAAAKKHGKGVQEFARQVLANKGNYSSAMVKKANFARNAAKWKHEDGGYINPLYTQQMMADGGYVEMGGVHSMDPLPGHYYPTYDDDIRPLPGNWPTPNEDMTPLPGRAMYGRMMAAGGRMPNNPGFRALPDYVQDKIMSNMEAGGKMPASYARARFAAAGNEHLLGDYGYAEGGITTEPIPTLEDYYVQKGIIPDRFQNVVPYAPGQAPPEMVEAAKTAAREAAQNPPVSSSIQLNPYEGVSVYDFLAAQNKAPDYQSRKGLAKSLGIENYRGTAAQNLAMIDMVRANPEVLATYTQAQFPGGPSRGGMTGGGGGGGAQDRDADFMPAPGEADTSGQAPYKLGDVLGRTQKENINDNNVDAVILGLAGLAAAGGGGLLAWEAADMRKRIKSGAFNLSPSAQQKLDQAIASLSSKATTKGVTQYKADLKWWNSVPASTKSLLNKLGVNPINVPKNVLSNMKGQELAQFLQETRAAEKALSLGKYKSELEQAPNILEAEKWFLKIPKATRDVMSRYDLSGFTKAELQKAAKMAPQELDALLSSYFSNTSARTMLGRGLRSLGAFAESTPGLRAATKLFRGLSKFEGGGGIPYDASRDPSHPNYDPHPWWLEMVDPTGYTSWDDYVRVGRDPNASFLDKVFASAAVVPILGKGPKVATQAGEAAVKTWPKIRKGAGQVLDWMSGAPVIRGAENLATGAARLTGPGKRLLDWRQRNVFEKFPKTTNVMNFINAVGRGDKFWHGMGDLTGDIMYATNPFNQQMPRAASDNTRVAPKTTKFNPADTVTQIRVVGANGKVKVFSADDPQLFNMYENGTITESYDKKNDAFKAKVNFEAGGGIDEGGYPYDPFTFQSTSSRRKRKAEGGVTEEPWKGVPFPLPGQRSQLASPVGTQTPRPSGPSAFPNLAAPAGPAQQGFMPMDVTRMRPSQQYIQDNNITNPGGVGSLTWQTSGQLRGGTPSEISNVALDEANKKSMQKYGYKRYGLKQDYSGDPTKSFDVVPPKKFKITPDQAIYGGLGVLGAINRMMDDRPTRQYQLPEYTPYQFQGASGWGSSAIGNSPIGHYSKYGGWVENTNAVEYPSKSGIQFEDGGTVGGNPYSIVDYLNSMGMASDKKSRAALAAELGIANYDFSAEKNLELLARLKGQGGKATPRTKKSTPAASRPAPRPAPYKPEFVQQGMAKESTRVDSSTLQNKLKKTDSYLQQKAREATMESGVIVDKRTNNLYVIKNGKPVKNFPVLTGKNPERDVFNPGLTMADLEADPSLRGTPTGTAFLQPRSDIYGFPGFWEVPIKTTLGIQPLKNYSDRVIPAVHITYPEQLKERAPLYAKPSNERYASYGCVNCRRPDLEGLIKDFPAGDTAVVVDSETNLGKEILKRHGIGQKEAGGFISNDYEAKGGQMIKRKDGSYSRRGLWDNIRANRGSGRKPTAEMLRQERKIKAKEAEAGMGVRNMYYPRGGEIMNVASPMYPIARSGANIRRNEGSQYEQGGELEMYDGDVKDVSKNVFSGPSARFDGPSHDNGGMDVVVNNKPIEVEGKEGFWVDEQGNAHIFGKLKRDNGKTFAQEFKDLAKAENKSYKKLQKAKKMLGNYDYTNPYEKLGWNSAYLKYQGAMQEQAEQAAAKQALAQEQQIMHEMANSLGIEPMELNKLGGKLRADLGQTIPGADYFDIPTTGPTTTKRKTDRGDANIEFGTTTTTLPQTVTPTTTVGIVTPTTTLPRFSYEIHEDPYEFIPDKFNYANIAPELYTAATNTRIPVRAQKFIPEMEQTYRLSPDIASEQAAFRAAAIAARRNPAQIAQAAAMKHQQVGAKEYATEAGNIDRYTNIINRNKQAINQAKAMNLGIFQDQADKQREQEMYRRDVDREVLSSMSRKVLEFEKMEKLRRLYEQNMYRYRLDPRNQQISYSGGKPNFYVPGVGYVDPNTGEPVNVPEGVRVIKKTEKSSGKSSVKAGGKIMRSFKKYNY